MVSRVFSDEALASQWHGKVQHHSSPCALRTALFQASS